MSAQNAKKLPSTYRSWISQRSIDHVYTCKFILMMWLESLDHLFEYLFIHDHAHQFIMLHFLLISTLLTAKQIQHAYMRKTLFNVCYSVSMSRLTSKSKSHIEGQSATSNLPFPWTNQFPVLLVINFIVLFAELLRICSTQGFFNDLNLDQRSR